VALALVVELPHPFIVDPHSPGAAEAVAALPESRGVYLFTLPGYAPHLGSTLNLRRRLTRLLFPSYTVPETGFARHFQKITSLSCWPAGSRLEASLLMYQITREHFPDDYLKRLRLRMPWFLVMDGYDAFPRVEIVNRLARRHTKAYGPFFSRDVAQRYEEELLGLFQIRRCTETLTPTPEHPGCIYGEMNQCLRPCQCAVSKDEYADEVRRFEEFVATNGKTAAAVLMTARERASLELDFEQAAQLHKRLEKVSDAAVSRDAVIAPVDKFNGLALTRGVAEGECRLWPMLGGYWQSPLLLQFSTMEPGARSLDQELREKVSGALTGAPQVAGNRVEQLAVFSRWYYSSWRDGHWFPFSKPEDLNYRRLVREISNLSRAC
jgi:excinuclease ABC subunit C